MTGSCETCNRPHDMAGGFCSYWCHLVVNGPAYYTFEAIQPWLARNRLPLRVRA